jgi:hypothetical protein
MKTASVRFFHHSISPIKEIGPIVSAIQPASSITHDDHKPSLDDWRQQP